MCGIAGIIRLSSNALDASHNAAEVMIALGQMLKAQAHRGPDATGDWSSPADMAFLGHNRLSIIDLSDAANQPFISADGKLVLVFNGEIYNYKELRAELDLKGYRFRTQSDTEVLLAAYQEWGEHALNRFNGMWSFAIWDNERHELFAARDRFGVKPFHFAFARGHLVFSSEIKALFASGLVEQKPSLSAWSRYLSSGLYASPESTFWEGIRQLPSGSAMRWANNTLKEWRWYDFVTAVNSATVPESYDKVREELWSLMQEGIALRLRSDVPIGINLSGGIDSTALTALIQDFPNVTQSAFTFHCGDSRYDERPWAQALVEHLQVPWREVDVLAEQVPGYAMLLQGYQDEPYAGVATIAYTRVFEAARQAGVIVLLDGGGLDEALGGYDYYGVVGDSLVQGTQQSPYRPDGVSIDLQALAKSSCDLERVPKPFADLTQNQQYRDLFFTKLPRDLRFNDRISMAFGTELREPFLNHRLVEFGVALPQAFKERDGLRKILVRDQLHLRMAQSNATSASRIDSLLKSPKRPIQTPQREWLRGPLRPWVMEQVEHAIDNSGMLNGGIVRRELQRFFEGAYDNSFFVWQWISLALMNIKR